MLNLAHRLSAAVGLARQAGEAVMAVTATEMTRDRKSDNSLVTNADLQSNELILSGLADRFPEDGILSEESGAVEASRNELLWVVDPLDGTKAFAAQIPGFSVMLGLLWRNEPVLGVVYDPLDGWLYSATSGGGARVVPPGETHGRPLQVSSRSDAHEMRLICSPGLPENASRAFSDQIGLRAGPSINSVGIKVGLLARQEGDVYFNYHSVTYWDTVAPLVVAQEAGAEATMLDGRPFAYRPEEGDTLHAGPSLITNGTCHDSLRRKMLAIANTFGLK